MYDELCNHVKELAKSGKDWNAVLHNDDIQDKVSVIVDSVGYDNLDKDKVETAFVEGRREYRIANGWIVCWTDARADYDQFDTEELECREWHNRVLRKVLMHPGNAVGQRSRYMSGASIWDADPRETERNIRQIIEREQEESRIHASIREAGLVWIRSVDEAVAANEDVFDNELRKHRLTWSDWRAEQKRREEEREANERAAEWAKCRAAFPDGCTIVDPGRNSVQGRFGVIPGSDCAVYRNVRVVPHWSAKDDPNEAKVEDGRHTFVGWFSVVAKRIAEGTLRVAKPDEVLPPNAVMDRVKPSRLDRVLRVEVEGRVVWACRETYSYATIIVLDEQGKLVRKKSVKEAAETALRQKDRGF